jgi:hypothetical protein
MLPPEPRKAGYTAPILQQMQVRLYTYLEYISLHGKGVYARMPLRIAPNP